MNKLAQGDVRNIFSTAIVIILTVYVSYAMISALVQSDPSFGRYGWPILAALVVGVIAFFRSWLRR